MTCRHVLDLIDAEPVVDSAPWSFDAAWAHAQTCPTCGAALAASRAMTSRLHGLAQPPAPVELKTSVMARIARLDETDRPAAPAVVRPARVERTLWPAAACLIAGWILVAFAYGITSGDMPFARVRLSGPAIIPDSAAGLIALMVGLACYVIGLLAPLAGRRRT